MVATMTSPTNQGGPPTNDDHQTLDYLWKIYAENRDTARGHQSMRAGLMNIVIAITSGVVAFSDKMESYQRLYAGLLLIILGVLSLVFTMKYYEREKRCYKRADKFYEIIDKLLPNAELVKTRDAVDAALRIEYGPFYNFSLHGFWYCLSAIIVSVGIFVAWDASTRHTPNATERLSTAAERAALALDRASKRSDSLYLSTPLGDANIHKP